MSIATQISRLMDAANRIKTKTASLGLKKDDNTTITSSDKLEKQAEAIENIKTENAKTIIPSTSEQTISAGTYLKGDQKIKAVSLDADASKIVTGNTVSIKSDNNTVTEVTGSLVVNKYIIGNTAPDSSTQGNDGDIYLVV
jgi:hypothetical protein